MGLPPTPQGAQALARSWHHSSFSAMLTTANYAAAFEEPAAAARPPAPTRPHWAWWLFLLGVLAFSCAGPACALQ